MRRLVTLFGLLLLSALLAACAGSNAAPPLVDQSTPAATTAAMPTAAPTMAPATAAPTMAPAATAAATTQAAAPTLASVMVASNSDLGQFLVDDKGMTLYLYTKDTPGTSNCYNQCAVNWPPLLTTGPAQAANGVDATLLGTTTRTDGNMQVTYGGWPLYYYIKDQKPGDVIGQDVGKVWYVISPQGKQIGGAAAAPAPAAPAASAPAAGETVKVSIKDYAFGAPLTIKAGTTVEWVNEDSAVHTVTADTGAFDSGDMAQGAIFKFTFAQAGTYPYYCKPHGGPGGVGMASQVIVTQ